MLALKLAHEIKNVCYASDPAEIRQAVACLMPCKMSDGVDDMTMTLDGTEWRFIRRDAIDHIMQEELSSDEYILGCFNSWFLAGILEIDQEAIEAIQKAEAYEALGKLVISLGKLEELQAEYASADGYGHHFGHHDGYGYELNSQPYYAFEVG